ncbi:hypothetical protein D7V93_00645 [Corallococcus llansteffanensis]|uniref:MFS transporter n=1 Tax=Corallococcus llansteffanensis TaxID=2316731 RepID=A0A3A8QJH4_9BACT|nr:hypothetical protein D7V93_00645 [Corallococcus llansteffanensis]
MFALGFLIRPVGCWLMGLYADLRGRRSALTLSVTLMCLGSPRCRGHCSVTESVMVRQTPWYGRRPRPSSFSAVAGVAGLSRARHLPLHIGGWGAPFRR